MPPPPGAVRVPPRQDPPTTELGEDAMVIDPGDTGSVSENATLVISAPVLLSIVNVSVDVPPGPMESELKTFVNVCASAVRGSVVIMKAAKRMQRQRSIAEKPGFSGAKMDRSKTILPPKKCKRKYALALPTRSIQTLGFFDSVSF